MFDPFSPLPPRPSHWPYRNAVGIVAVNEQGLVLMGEARGFQDIWKMPQGGVEAGESHQQAAKRELREETGLRRVTFERQAQLRSACEYPDGSNYMRGFRGQSFEWFLARVQDTKLDPAKFTPGSEDQEFGKLRWVTPQQALALAHNNYGGAQLHT